MNKNKPRERSLIIGPGIISVDEHSDRPKKTYRDHVKPTDASIARVAKLIKGRTPEYIFLHKHGPIVTYFLRGDACKVT